MYSRSQRFPNNRSRLYKKALRILLEEWAAENSILRDGIYEGLSIELEEILLSEIAYEGMMADQLFFNRRKLSIQIREYLNSNLNAPKSLDSEAVLSAIEVQQGILVERAEDACSFSHLTLQEYLTAQYLVDNNEWESLIRQHLTDNRWREIFLLLPSLITGKAGADKFLLAMEKQANTYILSHKLQHLVQWAETSTQESSGSATPSGKRVAALFLALALALALDRALNRALNLDLDRALDIDRDRDLDRALDIDRDRDRASYFSSINIFKDVDFDGLRRDIKKLRKNRPARNAVLSDKAKWLDRLHSLWFSAIGIDAEGALLSQEDSQSLVNYFYICELMIRCKESAERVSPDVWAGIESRILTVPASSEAVAD